MKMLTIHRPDHPAPNDFCHGIDGELAVTVGIQCDRAGCGCDCGLVGLNSARASSTVRVTEVALGLDDAITACEAFLDNGGWSDAIGDAAEKRLRAEGLIGFSAGTAALYETGTVLRPRFDWSTDCWTFTEAGKAI